MTYTAPALNLAHTASKTIQNGTNGLRKTADTFVDSAIPNVLPNSTTGAYEADE